MINKRAYGLALDIDGVFLKGSTVLPFARRAIKKIKDAKIPFIFITNGGGVTEDMKAQDLSYKLDTKIETSNILLSHTPFKKYVDLYRDKNVLILGKKSCLEVASNYGFLKTVTSNCIHNNYPDIYPMREPHIENKNDDDENRIRNQLEPISAAFVIHDPIDWALDIQVLSDTLLGGLPLGSNSKQSIPLYACNSDLVYMTTFHRPRYTQGAFLEAFKALFKQYTGSEPEIQYCGKPFPIQYRYAENMLKEEALRLGYKESELPMHFVGIGDNPLADIKGANDAGDHWRSILVKTGVFQSSVLGHDNDPNNPADYVFENVEDAIDMLLEFSENIFK